MQQRHSVILALVAGIAIIGAVGASTTYDAFWGSRGLAKYSIESRNKLILSGADTSITFTCPTGSVTARADFAVERDDTAYQVVLEDTEDVTRDYVLKETTGVTLRYHRYTGAGGDATVYGTIIER